ncbi:MAG: phosphotriesterase family protein [Acidimicrobiales bacterium]
MTVLGAVPSARLGRIMPHEHVLCDLRSPSGPLADTEGALEDLRTLKSVGGSTVVELTSQNLGRQPAQLRDLSEQSGVHIVMGSGWYRESFYDEDFNKVTISELADRLTNDITEGEGGVRPGIIGEIGADHSWVSAVEERVLRACARVQKQTGLGLVLHAVMSEVGWWQLDVLDDEGVDLRRVAVGHCDSYPDVDYHERIAKRGALVMYDLHSLRNEEFQLKRIVNTVELVKRGYGAHLLLSHDVCTPNGRRANGGPGYSYVITDTVPQLVEAGVPADVTEQIMAENPLQLLTGRR